MSALSPAVLAKLAALRAQKAESIQVPSPKEENQNVVVPTVSSTDAPAMVPSNTGNNTIPVAGSTGLSTGSDIHTPAKDTKNVAQNIGAGSLRTTDINHLDFLSKLQELQEKIHTQHPQMPVLLRTIHRQLMEDPEIVTLVSEEALGIIVKGLQIQTKTELIQVVLKESKTKAKKVALDIDMF